MDDASAFLTLPVPEAAKLVTRYISRLLGHDPAATEDLDPVAANLIPQSLQFMIDCLPTLQGLLRQYRRDATVTLLDVGPGTAAGSNLLAELHRGQFLGCKVDVDALDITDRFQDYASFRFPAVNYMAGDIFALPEDMAWDIVFCSNTVEHVPDPTRFIAELQRRARDWVVLYAPFDEQNLSAGHEHRFTRDYLEALQPEHLQIMPSLGWPSLPADDRRQFLAVLKGQASALRDEGVLESAEPVGQLPGSAGRREALFPGHTQQLQDALTEQERIGNDREMEIARLRGERMLQSQAAARARTEYMERLQDAHQGLLRADATLAQLTGRRAKARARMVKSAQRDLSELRKQLSALAYDVMFADSVPMQGDASGGDAIAPPRAKYDVFIFPVIPWDFRFQRPQQIAVQFANAGHRVFYFDPTVHQAGASALAREVAPNVYGVQLPGPPGMSIYQDEIDARTLEQWICALDEFQSLAGVHEAVGIVDLPFWTPLALAAQTLWGWKTIYDCMDEHSDFGNLSGTVLEQEDWLIAASDLVLATSRALHTKVASRAKRVLLLPNAADFDHFHQPADSRPLADLAPPIIGYYGAIAHWFDVKLVRRAARARPDWQFVLIGDTHGADVSRLETLSNVALLGEQPYASLPAFLHQFDVAMIPFRLLPLTRATNPVKFFEYLSAGKPVVAVALPELEPYEDLFYPVRNPEEFVPHIAAALTEHAPEKIQARVDLARRNTWGDRFSALREEIAALYGRVTIIIVSNDNLDVLRLCLESIWTKTAYPNYDVIVVDNGSGPAVRDFLRASAAAEPRLRVIANGENLGFARATNIGLAAATGSDHVVLLNDDTVVTRGWLGRMVRYLEDPEIGLVGPVTNWAGNEARIRVDYRDFAELDAFADTYARTHFQQCSDIRTLALFCAGIRLALLDDIGPLDERFEIGMFEDDDLSRRVRESGFRVVCAEDVFIHHWGRTSFDRLDRDAYERLFATNLVRYEEKWGETWQPHQYR